MKAPPTFAVTMALLTSICHASGADDIEGCYLSRPYQAGEKDVLSIKRLQDDTYHVRFHLIYCNYTMSPDCANARFEEVEFTAKSKNHELVHLGPQGCHLSINLHQPRRVWVTQHAKCEQFKFWGPHGIYTREIASSNKVCREH